MKAVLRILILALAVTALVQVLKGTDTSSLMLIANNDPGG